MSFTELNILSKEYNENPYYFIDNLDRNKRIIYDNTLGSKIVICYNTVKEILSKNEIFTTEPLASRAEPVMRGKVLAQMSGAEHKFKRSLITRQITGNILKNYYSMRLQDLCDAIILKLEGLAEFDFVEDFAKPYSMISTFNILGIDKKQLDFYHEKLRLIVKFATGFNISSNEKKIYISAAIDMEKEILKLIEEKRNGNGNDLISFILKENQLNNKTMTNSEIVALTLNILLAASEPVDKVLSASIHHLYKNRSYLNSIISDDIKTNDILQESLRITPPVHLIPRLATNNYITEYDDPIEKGEVVFILIPAANRDPAYFKDPSIFNPRREFKGHVSYGYGIHTCIGSQFSNMQLNLALDRLAPLLLNYEEATIPVFDGIYTRGTTSYQLKRKIING